MVYIVRYAPIDVIRFEDAINHYAFESVLRLQPRFELPHVCPHSILFRMHGIKVASVYGF